MTLDDIPFHRIESAQPRVFAGICPEMLGPCPIPRGQKGCCMHVQTDAYDMARDLVNADIALLYRRWRELSAEEQAAKVDPQTLIRNVVDIQEMNEGGR